MKKTNEFDADGFLAGMFNEPTAGDVSTTTTPPADPAPVQPGDSTTPGDGRPEEISPQPEDISSEAESRGQADPLIDHADLMPADGSWDELPDPEPCKVCGGINAWWGRWGERRCERCEPSGRRSTELVDKAARLRARQ